MSTSTNPVAEQLRSEFPKLFELSEQHDFAERLGGSTDPLLAEADAALREIWHARTNASARPLGESGTRVVATDLATGESEEQVVRDDYVVVTDGDRYVDSVQLYPKSGTAVVTIKRRSS